MIILLFYLLYKINEIPSLLNPIFVASDDRFIYVTSKEGIGIFDKYSFKFKKGIILEKTPRLAFPDPFTGEIYVLFSDGELISFYKETPQYYIKKGFFPNATSFSLTPSTIKIEFNNTIKRFDKYSMIETDKDENSIFWWGLRSVKNFNSNEISFLAPFYIFTEDGEKVNFEIICEDNEYYYACTKGEGVYVYDKDFWRNVSKLVAGTSFREVRVIEILENNGIIFAGTGDFYDRKGIILRKGSEWKRFSRFHFGLNVETFYSGVSFKDIIILASDGKIVIYKDNEFKTKNVYTGIPIYKILVEGPSLIIATERGLFITDIEGVSFSNVLKNEKIFTLEITKNFLYIGTLNGLFAIKKDKDESFRVLDKKLLLDGKIIDIKKDKEGNIWVMSEKGFLKFLESEDSFKFFYPPPVPFNPSNYYVQNSIFIFKKLIFLGTYKNGFWTYDIEKNRWDHFFDESSITKRTVFTFNSKKDTLFVGTDMGIYVYRLKDYGEN
ncbi:MAG: hypothetical protein ABIN20_05290 [candidate division WOR-3 bacterium]